MKTLISISAVIPLQAAAVDADKDGCWRGYHEDGGSCIEFDYESRGSRMYISYANRCDGRLFLTWCAGDKCGSDSLRPGQSKNKYVNTTGKYGKVYAVGSNRSSNDRMCKDRMGRW